MLLQAAQGSSLSSTWLNTTALSVASYWDHSTSARTRKSSLGPVQSANLQVPLKSTWNRYIHICHEVVVWLSISNYSTCTIESRASPHSHVSICININVAVSIIMCVICTPCKGKSLIMFKRPWPAYPGHYGIVRTHTCTVCAYDAIVHSDHICLVQVLRQ